MQRKRKRQKKDENGIKNPDETYTLETLREYDHFHPPPVLHLIENKDVQDHINKDVMIEKENSTSRDYNSFDCKESDDNIVESNLSDDEKILENKLDIEKLIMKDEFIDFFKNNVEPKVVITISSEKRPSKSIESKNRNILSLDLFKKEMCELVPNSRIVFKKGMALKKFIKLAQEKSFTDLIMFGEDHGTPNRVIICHLTNGGLTAHFKLTNMKLIGQIKNHGRKTKHYPELILNNFTTELGFRVGTIFAALFPKEPQFHGRQAAVFHNQRDFIFFRHFRYIFKDGKKVGLQELGPRFTLKLDWIQKGTFDTKGGQYEWFHKRHQMDTSRRRFFL